MESLKQVLEKNKDDIIKELGDELDRRHVGGDTFQANRALNEISMVHDQINRLLSDGFLPGSGRQRSNSSDIPDDIFMVGNDDAGPNDVDTSGNNDNNSGNGLVPQIRRFQLSWSNVRNGQIHLLPSGYQFPIMPLNNFITMWYCGDRESRIPPYRMLSYKDVKEIKGGKQKLCNMRKMVQCIEQAARLIGCSHLVDGDQRLLTLPKSIEL